MKLRVGLVGLGHNWEVRHRAALRSLNDRYEVRAVFDQVALRAEQAAREFNAKQVDGFRALARRDDIDAVLMLAPGICANSTVFSWINATMFYPIPCAQYTAGCSPIITTGSLSQPETLPSESM